MSNPLDALTDLLLREKQLPREVVSPQGLMLRSNWIHDLRNLMNQLVSWIGPLAAKGLLTVARHDVTMREAAFGAYPAPALSLRTPAGRTVQVIPRGRHVGYSEGRVDIVAPPRHARLLCFGPETPGANAWYFVSEPDADGRYQSERLDQDSFAAVLRELLQ